MELITQVATQRIEIWHNQSVLNLNGSFFRNKGSHTFEGTYIAEDTFLNISSTCLHQVSLASIVMPKVRQGFGMFKLLDDLIVNSYFNVFILNR